MSVRVAYVAIVVQCIKVGARTKGYRINVGARTKLYRTRVGARTKRIPH